MEQYQINTLIDQGKNITHFLNVKNADGIDGVPITQIVKRVKITITWYKYDNDMYYTNSIMFSDTAIALHTKMLFNGIEFVISKPLNRTQVLI